MERTHPRSTSPRAPAACGPGWPPSPGP